MPPIALAIIATMASAFAEIAPSLIVTETLKRKPAKQGKGPDAPFFQSGSWRLNFTIKLPLADGQIMDNVASDDTLTVSIGDYSFDGVFEQAAVDRVKKKAVFAVTAEDELSPGGAITVTWTADSVKIVGALSSDNPDAETLYALGFADERGKIDALILASAEISGAPESEQARASKAWQHVALNGSEAFHEVTKKGEAFLEGKYSVVGTADNVRPSVTVKTPRRDVQLENGVSEMVLSGSARDNSELAGVLVRIDGGVAEEALIELNAQLTKGEWDFQTPALEPGSHQIEVTAIDHDGLLSTPVVRTVTVAAE